MNGLVQEVRQALRRLARAPGLAASVVLTLAVAIGLDTAAFSLVDALLLRPLPVARPDELVHVYTASAGELLSHGPLAFPDFEDLRHRSGTFGTAAAYALQPMALDLGSGQKLVLGAVVTGGFFATLGIEPARGRLLVAADDVAGAPPVAVLSHAAWRRHLGGDPDVAGRDLRLSGLPFTVVGVAARGFTGLTPGLAADLWVPVHAAERLPTGVTIGFGEITPGAGRLADRSRRWAWMVARLRPGAGVGAARDEVAAVGRRLAAEHPTTHRDRRFAVAAVEDVRLLPGVDGALRAGSVGLLALAGLVLAIAVSNVSTLLLAGATARRPEMATRLALGAGRWQLGRQLLTESLCLALAGGAVGSVLALGSGRLVAHLLPALPWPVAVDLELRPDHRVLAFALGLSAATAVLFGLAPMMESLRTDLAGVLRGDSGGRPGGRRRLAHALVVVQLAVSLALLVGLGLTARSLARAQRIDLGLDPRGVVTATVAPELLGYPEAREAEVFRRFEEAVAGIPGVVSTAMAGHLPLSHGLRLAAVAAGPGPDPGAARTTEAGWVDVDEAVVGAGYFETLGIDVLAGRGFDAGDRSGSDRVVVVNRTLATRLWPRGPAVGRALLVAGEEASYRVVGEVSDGRYRTLREPPRPFLYRALAQHPVGTRTLVARAAGDPRRLLPAIERVAREVGPDLPILRLEPYERTLAGARLLPRAAAGLFALFGLLALGLAAVGVHGVLAHVAARRSHEMGVRMALGASRHDVVVLVVGEGARLAAAGFALGLGAALILGRTLRSLLYDVAPVDPMSFAGAIGVLATVAFVASYLPARRASRRDPAAVLRRA